MLPLSSLDFWTWYKPWGTPLLWKLLPGSTDVAAPIAQWLISVAAWLVLACVVYRVLRHRAAKLAGFALVLAFSLVPAVAVWDGALLTESLTLSLGALLLAALLLLVETPTWPHVAAVMLVSLLLAGTRAPNGYLAPFVLIPVALLVARRSERVAWFVAVGSVALVAMTYATSNVRQWEIALAEIVAGRVLHKPAEQAYFVDRGLPVWTSLEDDLWANRLPPYSHFQHAPALVRFLPWFNRDARRVYRDYLLSHPGDSLGDSIRDLPDMVSPSSSTEELQGLPLDVYRAKGYRSSLPGPLARLLYPRSAGLLLALAAAAVVAMAGLMAMRLGRAVWAVPLLGLASCVPHAIILWNGADTNIGRHALLLAVLLRLSLILALVFLADAYLAS
jgi:hypothetical protein